MKSGASHAILLVDDNQDILETLEIYLSEIISDEVKFIRSGDGLEALRKIDKQKFDLIITDINMPKLEGIDFIKRMKYSKVLNRQTPVIIMSGEVLRIHVSDAIKLKIVDILVKPVEPERLSEAVLKILGKKKKHSSKSASVQT